MTQHTSKPTKTIYIAYGFCEGPRLAQRLLTAIAAAGYTVTTDVHRADIILAHSGGCVLIPEDNHAEHIIMIDPPYWPGRSLFNSHAERTRNELREYLQTEGFGAWLRKQCLNLSYLWHVRSYWRMDKARRAGTYFNLEHVIVVRDASDPFCTPDFKRIPFTRPTRFVTVPGQHDDWWLHPERYLAVIQ